MVQIVERVEGTRIIKSSRDMPPSHSRVNRKEAGGRSEQLKILAQCTAIAPAKADNLRQIPIHSVAASSSPGGNNTTYQNPTDAMRKLKARGKLARST